ncbi:hypothetical protein [Thermococcus cleftensis]|nr:hypothetical protein [Thermococcus cleftensis]
MAMARLIYRISVVLTALALFWPVVYGNVPVLRILPGNPLIHAVAGLVVFGGLAYLTFGEEETGEKSGFTAS